MKYLSPQQAMLGMRVVLTDNGMIIKSPAGSAEYNLKGRRIKVTGYPEYFPGLLSMKDKRTKTGGWVNISAGEFTAYREDGSVSARIGRINPPEEQELVDEAYKRNQFGQDNEKPGLGGLIDMQNAIADQLDHLKGAWDQVLGRSSEGKVPVVMLGGRYTAIGGGYTPEEISAAVEHIQAIRSGNEFSKAVKDVSPFAIKKDGEVFIKDAFIGNGITTANWSMKVNSDENGHRYAAGVGIAVNNEATKTRLSDDIREAVIDAIRESDVFKVLLVSRDAQASDQVAMQLKINQAVTDAIRNAMKPGGLIHRYWR